MRPERRKGNYLGAQRPESRRVHTWYKSFGGTLVTAIAHSGWGILREKTGPGLLQQPSWSRLSHLHSDTSIPWCHNGWRIAKIRIRNDELAVKTIQMALKDPQYADALRRLLLRDGVHRVYSVDRPDLRLDGVIVVEGNHAEDFSMIPNQADRFVVITRRGSGQLNRIWDAGVRHVVFEGDAPSTAHLAIIAAEMRLGETSRAGASGSGSAVEARRNRCLETLR
jgi:hypothetical protein